MPEKLVVRVISAQSLDKKEEPKKPKEVVVYYWNRILSVLLLLIALLAGLVWGGIQIFKKTGEKLPPTAMQAAKPAQTAALPIITGEISAQPVRTAVADAPAIADVSILSNSIKRAQLTSGVKDDEPVDKLGNAIPMNDKGLIRVYLFMETSGLQGRVIFHDWYWKGKRMAHARIPIKRNRPKAVSSKFIDRIMLGPWEVEIVDEGSRVLAKTAFEVR